ncbi:hypothetical protein BDF14DRAFT_1747170 [Spinellus fusiger]|nr:hypothetical protein BDF14DRAFT_1747170 [Spinellus fusiger]
MSSKNTNDLPWIVYVPFTLCLVGIAFLLWIRRKQRQSQYGYEADTRTTVQHEPIPTGHDSDTELEQLEQHDQQEQDYPAEGSSTVRVRKIGKKKGDKLRRKEQQRQYQEYMQQQAEARRAQEQREEEIYQQRKLEESIRRADEMDRMRKAQAKKERSQENERQQLVKEHDKEKKRAEARFVKYSQKIKCYVEKLKVCTMETVASAVGLEEEQVMAILQQLCLCDKDFALSLCSNDTFVFVTREDYDRLNAYVSSKGRVSIEEAAQHVFFS